MKTTELTEQIEVEFDAQAPAEVLRYKGYHIVRRVAEPGYRVVRPDGTELVEWGRVGSITLAKAVVNYDLKC